MKNLEYAFKSYIGSQDRENSESFIHADNLFMVVDGFGIESLAETVKEETCRIVPNAFFRHLSENKSPADALEYAIEEANKKIIEERHKLGEKLAASICLIYFLDKIMYFTHLGDSRIYSFQAGELNQLTKDHTVKEDDPLAEKKYADPRALNALTHGLGIHEKPVVQVKKYPLDKRCLIILTTAGLTERVSNRDIAWLLKKFKRPEKIIRALIDLDKRKGGHANLTTGVIKCGGLTKMMRKVLMTYSVFIIFIAAIIGIYTLKYGSKYHAVQKTATGQSVVQEKTQTAVERPPEDKSFEEKQKNVVVQPIVHEQQKNKIESNINEISLKAEPAVEKKLNESPVMKVTTEGTRSDLFYSADDFVMDWKNAWEKAAGSKGDIDKYMSFYSDKFESGGFNKKTWRIDKETKNRRKSWIKIRISNLKISNTAKEDRMEARFTMNFKSSNFSGSSKKVLDIVKEGNTLKIIGERTY
jgi:serine/threonine protein phosphatase PrpC